MKLSKKGLTLVELLSVLIVLILIMLLAVKNIRTYTKTSKSNAIKADAISYVKAVNALAEMNGENPVYNSGTFTTSELKNMGLTMSGTQPDSGSVIVLNYDVIYACLIYKDMTVEYLIDNVLEPVKKGLCNTSSPNKEFSYTGNVQLFTAFASGYYKLEVWGAQGGNTPTYNYKGGYGGYSVGIVHLDKGNVLQVVVGGQGENECNNRSCKGGYNGGGSTGWYTGGTVYTAGGGGATHIAINSSGSYTTLASYGDATTAADYVLIAAGGGGGATYHNNSNSVFGFSHDGGAGGGITGFGMCTGTDKACNDCSSGCGGTQNATGNVSVATYGTYGSFGAGATNNCSNNGGGAGRKCYASGAGGGWYGGATGAHGIAAGGSGYIANEDLFDKSMYCYNCDSSNVASTKTISGDCAEDDPTPNCAKKGSGFARISYAGETIDDF